MSYHSARLLPLSCICITCHYIIIDNYYNDYIFLETTSCTHSSAGVSTVYIHGSTDGQIIVPITPFTYMFTSVSTSDAVYLSSSLISNGCNGWKRAFKWLWLSCNTWHSLWERVELFLHESSHAFLNAYNLFFLSLLAAQCFFQAFLSVPRLHIAHNLSSPFVLQYIYYWWYFSVPCCIVGLVQPHLSVLSINLGPSTFHLLFLLRVPFLSFLAYSLATSLIFNISGFATGHVTCYIYLYTTIPELAP